MYFLRVYGLDKYFHLLQPHQQLNIYLRACSVGWIEHRSSEPARLFELLLIFPYSGKISLLRSMPALSLKCLYIFGSPILSLGSICYSHTNNLIFLYAPVAQLDRASVFGTEGWGFKSLQTHQKNRT